MILIRPTNKSKSSEVDRCPNNERTTAQSNDAITAKMKATPKARLTWLSRIHFLSVVIILASMSSRLLCLRGVLQNPLTSYATHHFLQNHVDDEHPNVLLLALK